MINQNLEKGMSNKNTPQIKFTIDDIIDKYRKITNLNEEEANHIANKIGHDIRGSYASLDSIFMIINITTKEESDKKIIHQMLRYKQNMNKAVTTLREIVESKYKLFTPEKLNSEETNTQKNEIKLKRSASTIYRTAKLTQSHRPLLMSVINSQYRENIDSNLKELLDLGDSQIDKIINTHNNFFSKDDNTKYSKKNEIGQYLTIESIKSYIQNSESKLLGNLKLETNSELVSNQDVFSEYILPILNNIKDHAWTEKSWDSEGNELVNDIYNRSKNISKKCTIRTSINDEQTKFNILIEDNGYGIHPELEKKIFSQGSTGRKEKEDHGIGLNLLRNKIQKSGGDISFVTAQGYGTNFTITLPYNRETIENYTKTYIQ